jgi:hypothetical protein
MGETRGTHDKFNILDDIPPWKRPSMSKQKDNIKIGLK